MRGRNESLGTKRRSAAQAPLRVHFQRSSPLRVAWMHDNTAVSELSARTDYAPAISRSIPQAIRQRFRGAVRLLGCPLATPTRRSPPCAWPKRPPWQHATPATSFTPLHDPLAVSSLISDAGPLAIVLDRRWNDARAQSRRSPVPRRGSRRSHASLRCGNANTRSGLRLGPCLFASGLPDRIPRQDRSLTRRNTVRSRRRAALSNCGEVCRRHRLTPPTHPKVPLLACSACRTPPIRARWSLPRTHVHSADHPACWSCSSSTYARQVRSLTRRRDSPRGLGLSRISSRR